MGWWLNVPWQIITNHHQLERLISTPNVEWSIFCLPVLLLLDFFTSFCALAQA